MIILLIVVLGSVGTLWISTLPPALISAYDLGIVVCGMALTSAPFILVLLFGVGRFIRSLRDKLTRAFLTYVYNTSTLLDRPFHVFRRLGFCPMVYGSTS